MTTDPMNVMLQTESRMNHARDELARATNAHRHACEDVVRHDRAKQQAETTPTAYSPVPNDGKINSTLAQCQQDPGVAAGRGVGDLLEEAG